MSEKQLVNAGREGAILYLSRLLSFSLKGDPRPVAEAIVSRYGSIDLAASAPVSELVTLSGMTESAAILLHITMALTSRRITDAFPIGRAVTVSELEHFLIGLFLGLSVETVYIISFDKKGRVIACDFMGEGTVSSSDVYPRRLLECAVKRGASSVIIAHNHPRSAPFASDDDVVATNRLFSVFKSAGIRLTDHYVVAERELTTVPMG